MKQIAKKIRKTRQIIFDKYNGHCAYCGCDLPDKWHVDHVKPVVRSGKIMECPENDCLENMVPACPSCNINKHSLGIEGFRNLIHGFVNSLNRDSVQYKVAKRYGLIRETDIKVKFYFEL